MESRGVARRARRAEPIVGWEMNKVVWRCVGRMYTEYNEKKAMGEG